MGGNLPMLERKGRVSVVKGETERRREWGEREGNEEYCCFKFRM